MATDGGASTGVGLLTAACAGKAALQGRLDAKNTDVAHVISEFIERFKGSWEEWSQLSPSATRKPEDLHSAALSFEEYFNAGDLRSLPSAELIMAQGLDAEKITQVMLATAAKQNPDAYSNTPINALNRTFFKGVIQCALFRLIAMPAFADTLQPAFQQLVVQELTGIREGVRGLHAKFDEQYHRQEGGSQDIASLGSEALSIYVKKPNRWELLLLAQLLEDNLEAFSKKRLDRELGVSFGASIPLSSGSSFIQWCRQKIQDFMVLVESMRSIFHGGSLTVILDQSDNLLSVERIVHMATRFGEAYEQMLDWQSEFSRVVVQDEFQPYLKCLARYPDSIIPDAEEYVATMAEKVRAAPISPDEDDSVNISLVFDSVVPPPDVAAEQDKELKALCSLIERGLIGDER